MKLTIGIGALVVISRAGHLNWRVLGSLFSAPNTAFVLLGLIGINVFSQAFRWWIIVKKSFPDFGFIRTTQIHLIGSFFNFVFPSSIGGDLLRGYYIAQDHKELRLRAAFTVILDRFVGLYALIFLSAFFLLFHGKHENTESLESLRLWVWALCLFCTAFLLLVASGKAIHLVRLFGFIKLSEFVVKTHDQLRAFILDFKTFSATFVIGLISQVIAVLFFYWIATHTDMTQASFIQLLTVVPLGFLVMSLPISPAGIGVGQVAYLFLIQQVVGETSDFGATAISAFQVALLFWSLLGGWFYLTLKKPKNMEEGLNG